MSQAVPPLVALETQTRQQTVDMYACTRPECRSHTACVTTRAERARAHHLLQRTHLIRRYIRTSQYLPVALPAHPANLIRRTARSTDTRQVCTASYETLLHTM